MVQQHLPDGKLVYLHCSSIFNGPYAQIRQLKKVRQLLEKNQESIQILTNEYTLLDIAAVAKGLLEDQVFELLPEAKLRYPELFRPSSKSQKAKRVASEAEVLRTEAQAVQDAVLSSDDKGGENSGESSKVDEQEATLEKKVKTEECVQVGPPELGQAPPLRPRQGNC